MANDLKILKAAAGISKALPVNNTWI